MLIRFVVLYERWSLIRGGGVQALHTYDGEVVSQDRWSLFLLKRVGTVVSISLPQY